MPNVNDNHANINKLVLVLGTYNGGTHLAEQLDSIFIQTFQDFHLIISDDGSKDDTMAVAKAFAEKFPDRITITAGPEQGLAANFINTLGSVVDTAEYYAYVDQDDIWKPEKLERAIAKLQEINTPNKLYCSRTTYIDSKGQLTGVSSRHYTKKPSFQNALVQCIAGANTMMFDNTLARLVVETGYKKDLFYHDWWTYVVATAAGGTVYFDDYEGLLYRQHPDNKVGENQSIGAQWHRFKFLMSGKFKQWLTQHNAALNNHRNIITDDNLKSFDLFLESFTKPPLISLFYFLKSGAHRLTSFNNACLLLAVAIKRI